MTLDEAIQHCYDVANKGCDECAEEHLQLAKWLEELKRHRKFRVNKDIKNPFANISGYVCYHCDHKGEYIIEYENTGLTPNQVEQMKQENAELKRMLKLAADDANALFVACDTEYMKHDSLSEPEMCKFCKYYRTVFCKCEPVGKCQWRYADNVKGLIEMEINWIPLSERLPEHGQEVLGCEKDGFITRYRYDAEEPACWIDDHEEFFSLDDVVAWMPLPEPYKPNGKMEESQ